MKKKAHTFLFFKIFSDKMNSVYSGLTPPLYVRVNMAKVCTKLSQVCVSSGNWKSVSKKTNCILCVRENNMFALLHFNGSIYRVLCDASIYRVFKC